MFSMQAIQRYLDYNRPSFLPVKNATADRCRFRLAQEGFITQYKTEPRPYQWGPLYVALKNKQALLFLGPRAGKTKVALDYMTAITADHEARKSPRPRFLVVVPSDEIMSVWEDLGQQHSDLSITCAYPPTSNRKQMLEAETDLVIIPFSGIQAIGSKEAVSARKKKTVLAPNVEELRRIGSRFDGVIVDEIHHCKSSKSLRYKMMKILMENKPYRLGLTGTPFGRDPYALWAQFYLIDDGKTLGSNQFFFEQAFSCPSQNPFRMYEFDQRKNPILSRKVWGGAYSLTTMEALGVSAIEHNKVRLRPTLEQKERIREAVHNLPLGGEELKMTYMKMRQIASGFTRLPNGRDIPIGDNPKLGWLESEMDEFEGQAAIFYVFDWSGQQIAKLMASMKIPAVWIHGGQKDNAQKIRDYRSGKAQVAVIQCLVGSEGIDLSATDRQIIYECPDKVIVYTQMDYRAISATRTKPLVVDDLIVAPVEELIAGYMKEGKDLLKDIVFNPKLLAGVNTWNP